MTFTSTTFTSETFAVSATALPNLTYVNEPNGSALIEGVCFLEGTRVRTARGEVAVEALQVGDLAITASGKARPVRWLGHRRVDGLNHPRPSEVLPVRVAAHAFGENRPSRDLYLSPAHAVCVDLLGEVLVPVGALRNGSTIAQVGVDSATYWHVELESHDVLLAEGLPCESYLEAGNRGFFVESGFFAVYHRPDAQLDAEARAALPFCRPFHEAGPLVRAARAQLARRAVDLGWRLEDSAFAELHLRVGGQRIEPDLDGLVASFHVPPADGDAWLVCETTRPCDIGESADERDLGLALRRVWVDGEEIALDDPRLGPGLHAAEDGWRWTERRVRLAASLFADGEGRLTLELAVPALARWRSGAGEATRAA